MAYASSHICITFTKRDSDETGNMHIYGEWSVEGIKLYNKICAEIIIDCTEFKAVKEPYKKKNNEYEGKVDSLKIKTEVKSVVPFSRLT
jgi:hypothetical protein